MMEIEARAITAGYGRTDILRTVDISVKTGELVGLIGPNGSGKSTLMRALTGVLAVRGGVVFLDGHDLKAWSRKQIARRIAFVPQQEPTPFDYSVREIVLMGRYAHRERGQGPTIADFQAVAQALAQADILPLADRPVTQLSGGEHRRVLLARALAQQAALLLLDEPTAHLDLIHQVELLSLLRRLTSEQGTGAFAALHDLDQAAAYCDRLILIAQGKIVASGVPSDVLTAENLRLAYHAEFQVGRNPITHRPAVLAIGPMAPTVGDRLSRIHVISGGGSGVAVMTALVRQGFTVTAGVLNRLDSDVEAAEALRVETALESPFSPIGAEAQNRAQRLIAAADMVALTAVPFGYGNLANLHLLVEAQRAGKEIILLGDETMQRDFVGGEADALLSVVKAQGAQLFRSEEAWLDTLYDTKRIDGNALSVSSARDGNAPSVPHPGVH